MAEDGEIEVDIPRDRNSRFEPQLVKKHQRRFTSMDDKIHCLYAKGMTTREIVATFKEMYDADVSASLISKVTDAVIEQVIEWQSRPLDPVYPIVYLDCIVVKIRQDKRVINKSIYLALDEFSSKWDSKYPQISESWRAHWHNLNTLFNYPEDIRKAIYTTNAIESLNSVIRKVIKKRKLFPTDDSAKKAIYLAIQEASKKWTMRIRNWKVAPNRFMIEFEDRVPDYA